MATGWMRRLRRATGDTAGAAARILAEAERAAGAGERDEAARLGGVAVTELRESARACEPALVSALCQQSGFLAALSRHAEAVAAAEEAAAIARAEPRRTSSLLVALTTLATRLVEAGRPAEGLETAREARAVSGVEPDATLALRLATLGAALAGAGEHPEALAHSERAVGMLRALGADPRIRFQLGQALTGHADRLLAAGRWADATEFTAEAVAVHRERAREDPEKLAAVLSNYSITLSRVGRAEEALAAAAEAADLTGAAGPRAD